MSNFQTIIKSFALVLLYGCTPLNPQAQGTNPVEHQIWSKLLARHVDENGMVNYKGFKKDQTELDQYIQMLSSTGPNEKTWSTSDQLTYWINAYNALTVKLILDYYPVKSIKDIGSTIKIPFISTAWDIEVITVGNEKLTLNDIEHNIIRKKFEEPRIHFALVCAAKSCPKLRNEAYESAKLEEQLADQTRSFLTNKSKNEISKTQLKLSKLFSWYGGDFTKGQSLIDFLNQYAPIEINKSAKKSFMNYDWSLNEQ